MLHAKQPLSHSVGHNSITSYSQGTTQGTTQSKQIRALSTYCLTLPLCECTQNDRSLIHQQLLPAGKIPLQSQLCNLHGNNRNGTFTNNAHGHASFYTFNTMEHSAPMCRHSLMCIQVEKLHTEVQRVQWIAKPISHSLYTNIHIIAV